MCRHLAIAEVVRGVSVPRAACPGSCDAERDSPESGRQSGTTGWKDSGEAARDMAGDSETPSSLSQGARLEALEEAAHEGVREGACARPRKGARPVARDRPVDAPAVAIRGCSWVSTGLGQSCCSTATRLNSKCEPMIWAL